MPGYGDFSIGAPVTLDALLRYEATHCAKCGEKTSSLRRINGLGYCDQCAGAVEVAASRRIEDAREECGASG